MPDSARTLDAGRRLATVRPLAKPAGLSGGRRWLPFAVILAIWAAIAETGFVTPFLLPSPATVARTAFAMAADGMLAKHLAASAWRVFYGFLIAVALAVPLAVGLATTRPLRDFLEPPLDFLRHIPPLGLILLLILWFGIGEASKLAIIVLAAFFPLFLSVLGGIVQCDPKLVEVGRMCRLTRAEALRRIVLPAAGPTAASSTRTARPRRGA